MPDFAGSSVAAFEGRRVEEMARLIEARHGVAVSAPATRIQLLEAGPDVVELASRLRDDELDGMLFLSEPGVRHLPQVTAPVMGRSELVERLGKIALAARSPRVAAALAELGLEDVLVPDPPHTWKPLVEAFDRAHGLAGAEIAFQESGIIHSRMQAELMDRGAQVLQVSVYRWGLPEDLGPLVDAIERIADGSVRVALFTNAAQIENVMAVASERDVDEPLRDALRASVVGAIGTTCVDRLRAFGIEPDVVPEHPRLEELVEETARRAAEMLESG